MADAFVQSFTAISDPEERLVALNKLTRVLSFAERKVLIDAVLGRNDIVPALPLELLIQVFKNLHIHDAWSLQLVNRRWRAALSSDQFLRAAVLLWNTHDPSDSGRSAEAIAHDSVRDRIRHMQSLRLGTAFSQVEYDDTGTGLQGPQPQLSQRKLDLKGKNIAYISSQPGEGDSVVLRDLVTGSLSTFRGDARERILCLALSTHLLAFATFEGYLHVIKFSDPTCSERRRLPSAHIRALSADGSTVAVAVGESGSNVLHVIEVLLFDTTTSQFKSIDITAQLKSLQSSRRSQHSSSILIDSRKEIIDIFTLVLRMNDARDHRYLDIVHLRISFGGDVVNTSSFQHALKPDEHVRRAHFTMAPPTPTGYRGCFRIQVGEVPLLGGLPLRLKFDAIFDADKELGGGFVHEGDTPRVGFSDGPDFPATTTMVSFLHARWKTIALRAWGWSNTDWPEYYSLMNDTFLVSLEVSAKQIQHSRIRVFCFDPRVDMFNGRSTGFWEDGELLPRQQWRAKYRQTAAEKPSHVDD